jgi:hypothetical protein
VVPAPMSLPMPPRLLAASDDPGGTEINAMQMAGKSGPCPPIGLGGSADGLSHWVSRRRFEIGRALDPDGVVRLRRAQGRHRLQVVHGHEFRHSTQGAAAARWSPTA